jgi:ABC-type branched-subunit amino acid transport system substrate-binding protein
MKSSGATIFVNFASAKFAAQAIKKAAELNWRPIHILHGNSQSISAVLKPAGLENAKDTITANYIKDPDDPAWKDDAGMQRYLTFAAKYLPNEETNNAYVAYGYTAAQAIVKVLEMCGDTLTRENVLRQAESLKDVDLDLLLPTIRLNTSTTDHFPIEQMQLQRFDGVRWVGFGPVIEGSVGN